MGVAKSMTLRGGGGGGGGPTLSVTMTLIFPKIVWTCPLTGRARSFLLVFKNKIERRGRQNKNNKPINLLNGITFSTYFKYTTQS